MSKDNASNNKSKGILSKIIKGAVAAGVVYNALKSDTSSAAHNESIDDNNCIKEDIPENHVNPQACISNGSFIAQHGEFLYYGIDGALYRSEIDGSCPVKIDSISASCIYIYNEWIYFLSVDGIYKIHISGRTRTKLSDVPAKYMVLAGGRLFIIDKFGIFHCMNESGEEIKDTGLQKPNHLSITNDRIYYVNTKQEYQPYVGSYCTFTYLYETDLNFKYISSMVLAYIDITSQKSPIIVSDGYVYHIELGSLLRSEKNKDNSTLNLQNSVENNFIVSDGWIYFGKYHNREDNKSEGLGTLVKHMLLDDLHVSDGLYRMRTDGTCLTKMSPDDWCYKNEICLIGNYIYSKKGSSFNHLKRININTACQ